MSAPPNDCPDCGDTCWIDATRPDGSPAVAPCPRCVPDTPESRPRHQRPERLPLAAGAALGFAAFCALFILAAVTYV